MSTACDDVREVVLQKLTTTASVSTSLVKSLGLALRECCIELVPHEIDMFLTFCISRTAVNVALGKPASQSSTNGAYEASRCVDGNKDPVMLHGSCSHTSAEEKPWWRVDLLTVHFVHHLTITNRNSSE